MEGEAVMIVREEERGQARRGQAMATVDGDAETEAEVVIASQVTATVAAMGTAVMDAVAAAKVVVVRAAAADMTMAPVTVIEDSVGSEVALVPWMRHAAKAVPSRLTSGLKEGQVSAAIPQALHPAAAT